MDRVLSRFLFTCSKLCFMWFEKQRRIQSTCMTDTSVIQECVICLNTHTDTDTTKEWISLSVCQHQFHKHCLHRWSLHSTTCPLCRVHIRLETCPTVVTASCSSSSSSSDAASHSSVSTSSACSSSASNNALLEHTSHTCQVDVVLCCCMMLGYVLLRST